MWKVLRWTGYILGGILVFVTILFGVLYVRYSTQSAAIHDTVDSFIAETRSGTTESLQPYVHPEFLAKLIDLLNNQNQFFSRVVNVEENKWYFDYNWKSGIGETTAYHGNVTWDSGETGDYDLKLIKMDGRWVVYGVNVLPHTEEDSASQ